MASKDFKTNQKHEILEYLASIGLKEVMNKLTYEVVCNRPKDPIDYFIKRLEELKNNPDAPFIETLSDDEDDEEEEEGEEMETIYNLKDEGEEVDEKLLLQWNKPEEWDAKLGRAFLKLGKLLLKPVKSTEAFFYTFNPRFPLKVEAPKDVDPRSDKTIKDMMNFASCPEGLRSVIPNFHGVKHVSGHPYIAMDNLMVGIRNPAMCDVKLGTREHDPFANTEKISDTENRFSKRPSFGFRIVGMRTWADKNTVDKRPKTWGSTLENWEGVVGDFASNFVSKMTEKQKVTLLEELEKIDKLWTDIGSKEILIFSSSLFIVYESAKAVENDDEVENDDDFDPDRIYVKIIDFAHSFYRKDHPDVEDGVLQGIRNIRRAFVKAVNGSTGDLGDGPVVL